MNQIIKRAREFFYENVKNFGSDPYSLLPHVPEVEKWAKFLINKHSEVDGAIVLLGVWLHDVGHYPLPSNQDHAIRGENVARKFLVGENYDGDNLERVLHCVRAHRCKDVVPETMEAKVVAFSDSASHMTTGIYLEMSKCDKEARREFQAFAKLERDFRDLSFFPERREQMRPLYESWKNLLGSYEKLEL